VIHIERSDLMITTAVLENVMTVSAADQERRHHYSVPFIVQHVFVYRIFTSLTPVDIRKNATVSVQFSSLMQDIRTVSALSLGQSQQATPIWSDNNE